MSRARSGELSNQISGRSTAIGLTGTLTREASHKSASTTMGDDFVDPPSCRRDDPVDEVQEVRPILEVAVGLLQLSESVR